MIPAVIEFQVRYFRWGLKSLEQEIARDFARLKTTKTSTIFHLLSTMRALASGDRMRFGRALIKRRRLVELNASEIDGEIMTPAEISMCEGFLDDFALCRTDEELELGEE